MVKSSIIILTFFSLASFAQNGDQCVPAYEFIPFESSAWAKPDPQTGQITLGTYSRISPDGQYVLRSLSGQFLPAVTLMKLSHMNDSVKKASVIETRFSNEAFAVQKTWRFLVDLNKEHHRLENVIQLGKSSKADFKAGVMGFYTTAAELKTVGDITEIRSLSWPSGDEQNQGQGELYNKVYQIKKDANGRYNVLSETNNNYLCRNLKKSEGSTFTLPMISMDGTEFSAMPVNPANGQPSMRIYKIGANNKDCELVDDLKTMASKMIFGYPRQGKKALVVYTAGPVFIYDRDLEANLEITGFPNQVVADAFPGFTVDGRIVFAAHWSDCSSGSCVTRSGYVRVDPYQTPKLLAVGKEKGYANHYPKCITHNDVSAASEWFK